MGKYRYFGCFIGPNEFLKSCALWVTQEKILGCIMSKYRLEKGVMYFSSNSGRNWPVL